jgi:regulator of protease activity HflC (stomatin/prohibitin superfamily)
MKTIHIVLITIGSLILISALLYGCPTYRVWQQGKEGEAELKKAQQNRQITIQEAQAKKEAAVMLAEAEIIRAKGIDSVNRIIADGLKGNEAYLHYLWLQALEKNSGDIIYIPTEANMPILEAGRLSKKAFPKIQNELPE